MSYLSFVLAIRAGLGWLGIFAVLAGNTKKNQGVGGCNTNLIQSFGLLALINYTGPMPSPEKQSRDRDPEISIFRRSKSERCGVFCATNVRSHEVSAKSFYQPAGREKANPRTPQLDLFRKVLTQNVAPRDANSSLPPQPPAPRSRTFEVSASAGCPVGIARNTMQRSCSRSN